VSAIYAVAKAHYCVGRARNKIPAREITSPGLVQVLNLPTPFFLRKRVKFEINTRSPDIATDIISSIDAPVVQIINKQITTTSTDLAKCFGKHHRNVLRKIESLECSAEFSALNFELAEYKDEQDKARPM
jgi:hypothetical protein